MTDEQKIEAIKKDLIEYAYTDEYVDIHNRWCSKRRCEHALIWEMKDFNEIMGGQEPIRIVSLISQGNFNPLDEYFYYYLGKLYSTNDPARTENCSRVDEIAKYCVMRDYDFGYGFICEVLEEDED